MSGITSTSESKGGSSRIATSTDRCTIHSARSAPSPSLTSSVTSGQRSRNDLKSGTTSGPPVSAATPNVIVPGKGQMPLVDINAALAESAVTWSDLRWIRESWKGPIVVKGVLTAEDALHSIDEGAAAISVSNHGGRQLDGVPASLRVLPEVVDAVKGRIEVLMDGGVRRGTDVVKAICMGARAVLCGRAYAYGLAAAGEAGVDRAIEILRVDLERTLRLLGCSSVRELDRSYVNVPKDW